MGIAIAVALGGALGSVVRLILSRFIQIKAGIDFPAGTLLVNILGSFLIGISFSLLVERLSVSPETRALVITGFLGGLTTFSTFSYESFSLLSSGESMKFILYVAGTNLIGIMTTLIGYNIGRIL